MSESVQSRYGNTDREFPIRWVKAVASRLYESRHSLVYLLRGGGSYGGGGLPISFSDACAVLKVSSRPDDSVSREKWEHEVSLQRVLAGLGCAPEVIDARYPCMFMEHAGISLDAVLERIRQKDRSMPPEFFLLPALECARCIGKLHTAGYIHADIKPENIAVGSTGCIRMIDCANAEKFSLRRNRYFIPSRGCTLSFAAPEQLGGHITFASDVFSLGASFCTLFSRDGLAPIDMFPLTMQLMDSPPAAVGNGRRNETLQYAQQAWTKMTDAVFRRLLEDNIMYRSIVPLLFSMLRKNDNTRFTIYNVINYLERLINDEVCRGKLQRESWGQCCAEIIGTT